MYPEGKMDIKSIERFLRNSAYSATTIKNYRYCLRRLAAYLMVKGLEWEDVGPDVLLDFLDRTGWGEHMRSQAHTAARAIVAFYHGSAHPLFELPVKKPKPKPQRTMNEKEVVRLLASIDREKPQGVRNLAMAAVMLDTGIRAAEVCRFELKHLDLEDRSFRVKTKGGLYRTKVISEVTAVFLADWLEMRPRYARKGVTKVFVGIGGSTPGDRLTTSGLRNIFRRMGQVAKVAGLSPHVMRRTLATLSTIYGAPAVVLQKAGGWEDIRTMSVYTQAVPERSIEEYLPTTRLLGVAPDEPERSLKLDVAAAFGGDPAFDWVLPDGL